MRDTIDIREQGGSGRMVYLASGPQGFSPSADSPEGEGSEILEQPACQRHCPEGSPAYAEAVNSCMLPNVKIRLKTFATQVHTLLQTHEGNMPLMRYRIHVSRIFRIGEILAKMTFGRCVKFSLGHIFATCEVF